MEENFSSGLTRQVLQYLSRLGEGALGAIPGAISFLSGGAKDVRETFSPFQYLESFKGSNARDVIGELLGQVSEKSAQFSPEGLREYTKKWSKGYLEPQTPLEEGIGEFFKDVGSFSSGGIGRAVTTSALANTAYNLGKLFLPEEKARTLKIATFLTTPFINVKSIKPVYDKLFQEVEELGTKVDPVTGSLVKKGTSLANNIVDVANRGYRKMPHKDVLRRFGRDLDNALDKGSIGLDEVIEFKRDLSNLKTKLKVDKNPAIRHVVNKAEKYFDSIVSSYKEKSPELFNKYKEAEVLRSIDEATPFLNRMINKVTGLEEDSMFTDLLKKGLIWSAYGIKGLVAHSLLKNLRLGRGMKALMESPEYRKEMLKLTKAVMARNSAPAINSLRKIKKFYNEEVKVEDDDLKGFKVVG